MESLNSQGFSFDLPKGNSSIIKVIGVGGGGNNALKHMYERGIHGVDFIVCNTDAQTLDNNPVSNKVQLGTTITEGLGAGADPEIGEKSAIESIDEIKSMLGHNTKMVFITAGMGGGTGTGAAPVIAKIAKEMGILTVAIVTVPFSFEGRRRLDQADAGLEKLRNNVDSLIVINNDKLRQQFGNLGFKQGFAKADEVLTNAAKAMAEVITGYFTINIDFRDAKSVLENSGTALMSTGIASGENKAEEAVKKALDSPLLNDNKITGAKNVLLLIRSGNDEATMDEIGLINDHIQKEAGNTADIIFGVGSDDELGDAISVLVIATGFEKDNQINSGTSEKIRFNLNDSVGTRHRNSPFKSREEREEPKTSSEGKNFFRLDDEDDSETPQFKANVAETKTLVEEPKTQVKFYEREEIIEENFAENAHEEAHELDLFSYEENEEDLEPQSFNFETEANINSKVEEVLPEIENKKEESLFTEEKPIEFSFFFNETEEKESDFELKNEVIPEVKEEKIVEDVSATLNTNSSPKFLVEETVIASETKQTIAPTSNFEEKVQDEVVFEKQEEFTFIKKATSHETKVQERRNKLKEFNSRYQVAENENDFETIPAFRRKNIAIEGHNASEQNISSFLSENERGQMQVRENRFLNKDVD